MKDWWYEACKQKLLTRPGINADKNNNKIKKKRRNQLLIQLRQIQLKLHTLHNWTSADLLVWWKTAQSEGRQTTWPSNNVMEYMERNNVTVYKSIAPVTANNIQHTEGSISVAHILCKTNHINKFAPKIFHTDFTTKLVKPQIPLF